MERLSSFHLTLSKATVLAAYHNSKLSENPPKLLPESKREKHIKNQMHVYEKQEEEKGP